MIPPTVYTPAPAPSSRDDACRDLVTSLRLLSGSDCRRDAGRAQMLLVRLTQSRHDDVAGDARAVLRAGLARGWFDATTPRHDELERLAARSLDAGTTPAGDRRLLWSVGLGLAALGALLGFFVTRTGEDASPIGLIVFVDFLLIAAMVLFFARRR